jgi:hypothetical protein
MWPSYTKAPVDADRRFRYLFDQPPKQLTGEFGAQERTRTFTPFRELAPEASASTNSATWARLTPEGRET